MLFRTPDDFFQDSYALAQKIKESGKEYDAIVGLIYGGLGIARLLGDLLEIKVLVFVDPLHESLDSPDDDGVQVKLELTQSQLKSIKDKRVLLVDDLVNSGDRMSVGMDLIKPHCKEVATAAYYIRDYSKIQPDYYLESTDAWVVFPYELVKVARFFLEDGKSLDEIRGEIIPAEYFDRIKQFL